MGVRAAPAQKQHSARRRNDSRPAPRQTRRRLTHSPPAKLPQTTHGTCRGAVFRVSGRLSGTRKARLSGSRGSEAETWPPSEIPKVPPCRDFLPSVPSYRISATSAEPACGPTTVAQVPAPPR